MILGYDIKITESSTANKIKLKSELRVTLVYKYTRGVGPGQMLVINELNPF